MSTINRNNPDSGRVRKSSLPALNAQNRKKRVLPKRFGRQMSFPGNNDFCGVIDHMSKAQNSFSKILKKTGVTFSDKMYRHFCQWDSLHPENPKRLKTVLEKCLTENLISECEEVPGRLATNEELETCHNKSLIHLLKEQETRNVDELKKISAKYDSIYINQDTHEVARWAAGSSLELATRILDGQLQNGFAFVRPPGHHAMTNQFCGYSFFNNAAIVAKMALKRPDVNKVLIVDWDVHHGQGTQQTFYDDPRVLYFSVHRYERGHFWPNLRESDFDFIGHGLAKGFNFNIPLNKTKMKNVDYLAIFHQVLLPVAYEFNPDFIVISAGFDSAYGDPKGEMCLTPSVYGHLTSQLMALAEGRVLAILEGGYFPPSMAEGAAMTLRALLGKPCSPLVDDLEQPRTCLREILRSIISIQGPYWKCFEDRQFDSEKLYRMPDKHPSSEYPEVTENSRFPIENCYPLFSKKQSDRTIAELERLQKGYIRHEPPHKVCIVYDSDMERHSPAKDNSPEMPIRTQKIMDLLQQSGILDRLHRLPSRSATLVELSLVQSDSWVTKMEEITTMNRQSMDLEEKKFTSIYFNQQTSNAAKLAAGCLLNVVDEVCTGKSQSGIAVIRPPGHHASPDEPSGFCMYNNVAIAAQYARKQHNINKILIVDWDVHHGDGIQEIFEADNNVLYISIHLYNDGKFFPHGEGGNLDKVGIGNGEGFNINIPWKTKGRKDGDYMSAFARVVLPVAYQFKPDLVLVSAGFDAAINDPLGCCKVTPECFGHLTHLLKPLAGGKVILALEGGYNAESISHCMSMCAKALLGDPLPGLGPPKKGVHPDPQVTSTIDEVVKIQRKYWPILVHDIDTNTSCDKTPESSDAEFETPPQSPEFHTPMKTNGHLTDLTKKMSEATFEDRAFAMSFEEPLIGAVGPAPTETTKNFNDNASEMLAIQMMNEQMYAVVPLTWCPHLETNVRPLPEEGLDARAPCYMCKDPNENWVCLTCYKAFCSRYVEGHMLKHSKREDHHIVLSYSDMSVWCYQCESYLDNAVLDKVKKAACTSKFGC